MVTKPLKKTVVYASELAACVGYNRYSPVETVAEKIWSRIDPTGYAKAIKRNKVSEKPKIEDTIETLCLGETVTAVVNSSAETLKSDIAKMIETLPQEQPNRTELIKDLTSFVQTERGKSAEEPMLNTMQKK